MDLIILAGMPATGKSTVARRLNAFFGYPVLEKDGIKEALFDTIGFECYAEKRRLDLAATEVMFRMMEILVSGGTSLIVDNNFDEEGARRLDDFLKRHSLRAVTVFLQGDPEVLYERYVERDSQKKRHLGHAMQTHYPPHPGEDTGFFMTREGFRQRFLSLGMDQIGWGGKQLFVDTTDLKKVDLEALTKEVARLLKESEEILCEEGNEVK